MLFKTQSTNDQIDLIETALSERELFLCGKRYNLGFLHRDKRPNSEGIFNVYFDSEKPDRFVRFIERFQFAPSPEPDEFAITPV